MLGRGRPDLSQRALSELTPLTEEADDEGDSAEETVEKRIGLHDQRLDAVMGDRGYLEATQDVLRRHDGLWFLDESYVISRKRD